MGLVDYISREPQQKAVNVSAYDEQFIVAKLDAIKRSAKRFLLNAENYIDFATRNPLIKQASNTQILCIDDRIAIPTQLMKLTWKRYKRHTQGVGG